MTHTKHETSTRTAITLAILLALGEIADAPFIKVPAAVAFAVLFVASAYWAWRGRTGGLWLIVVLCAAEIVFIPSYSRSNIGDWVVQTAFAVVSAIALAAAATSLRRHKPAVSESATTARTLKEHR